MKWQKKLTKKQLAHFRFATHGDMTLTAFKAARDAQHKLDPIDGCCLECKFIARKLGIEGKEGDGNANQIK